MNWSIAAVMAGGALSAALAARPDLSHLTSDPAMIPPATLPDGRVNHQIDWSDPWVFSPYSELPADITPVIVAGDPNGNPPDSPNNRIDPNLMASAYAGTCSLFIGGAFICSGTPVTNRHIVSAGHCVDNDDNGDNDFGTNITITFNVTGNSSHIVNPSGIQSVTVHPNFTGFNNPTVNDDIIVITLKPANALPASVPLYGLYRGTNSTGNIVHLVGYGTTGDAVNGYIDGSASFNTKRRGQNRTDRGFFADDEGSGMAEIFQFDMDGASGLGNDIETQLGGGDSGGPSYIEVSPGVLELYAVNTFTGGGAPGFGSLGGGMLINGYLAFLDPIIMPVPGDFALTGPVCGAAGQSPTATFQWDDASNADTYTFEIATDAGMTNIVHTASGLATSQYAMPGGVLDACESYHWRVTAFNTNGQKVSLPTVCAVTTAVNGDINNDGMVDTADLGGLIGSFGFPGPFADLNGDNTVNTADLGILLANFGQDCD